jgi:hypothetical protein
MMSQTHPSSTSTKQLAAFFRRNGYVRRQNEKRLNTEGWSQYKKGDEVRLVVNSQPDLAQVRRLLRQAGFKLGRPFAKGRQTVQPIYGRQAVERFLSLVGPKEKAE